MHFDEDDDGVDAADEEEEHRECFDDFGWVGEHGVQDAVRGAETGFERGHLVLS